MALVENWLKRWMIVPFPAKTQQVVFFLIFPFQIFGNSFKFNSRKKNQPLKKLLPKRNYLHIALECSIVLAPLFCFVSCNQVSSSTQIKKEKSSDTISETISKTSLKPKVFYLTDSNRPKILLAKKPVIIKDSTHGGTPFFAHYGTEQGLPLNSALCSVQDKAGNIWFGTVGGVSRYDGKGFTNFSIAQGLLSNVVLSIAEDQFSNIWIGTTAGVSKYDGYRFTNFTTVEGLAGNFVSCIARDGIGNLWFGTSEGGISRFDGKKFTNFSKKEGLPDNYVHCILPDKNGDIWIATGTGGVSEYNGVYFKNYSRSNGLASNSVNTILQDRYGNLWFGTTDGLSKFDGKKFTTFNTSSGLPGNNIICLKEDHNGNLWLGTQSGGFSKFDGKGFTNYHLAKDLPENNITSILEDISGNLWFTTQGDGVSKFQGNGVTRFAIPPGLKGNLVFTIMQDKFKNIWFATNGGGISKYDGKNFTNYQDIRGLTDELIWSIFEDNSGALWFGTDRAGMSKFDGKNFSSYTTRQGLPGNTISSMVQDKHGDLWFSTYAGVSKFDGTSFQNFSTAEGLPQNNILNITIDRDENFWFGTHENGVTKFDGKTFTNYTTAQGLVSNTVYESLLDKHGNLWFATNKGASKFDGKKFINYTTENGMADDYIWAIGEDPKRDLIWFGTNHGLSVLKQNESKNGRARVENFNEKNGYPISEVNSGALLVDGNGIVWVGSGQNSLFRFDYSAVNKPNLKPLKLAIENIKVNNENVCWNNLLPKVKDGGTVDSLTLLNEMITSFGKVLSPRALDSMQKKYRAISFDSIARFYPVPVNLVLPYNFNTITIDFSAIEPSVPQQVSYQFKLEGYSKNFSPAGNVSSAFFENIPAGDYTLRIKAFSADGVLSEAAYAFKVLPPWWLSWWAYTLYALSILGILYAFFQWRIKIIQRKQAAQIHIMVTTQEEERERIARDLHDDVGIKLSALKLFLSSLQEKAGNSDGEIKSLAHRSENLVGEAMQDVRRLLRNLSPGVLEEFGYTTAIEGLINKINETGQIHFDLVTFGMQQRLHKDYELALYRITQELINNILKHAGAKSVSLQIGLRDEKIILMIEDDGKGFAISGKKEGHGLHNLELRTKLMKGTMNIDSQPGKGTSVFIEIPYNQNSL